MKEFFKNTKIIIILFIEDLLNIQFNFAFICNNNSNNPNTLQNSGIQLLSNSTGMFFKTK